MSKKQPNTKELIYEYLTSEGILKGKLPDPKSNFEFGFVFSFPPAQEKQRMSVFKPKNKDYIIVMLATQISEFHIKSLKSLKENPILNFFKDLRKFLVLKEVYFQLDPEKFRFELNDQIYLNNYGYISKNKLFKSIRKLFYCFMYINIMLDEYSSEKHDLTDSSSLSFDFSLYS